ENTAPALSHGQRSAAAGLFGRVVADAAVSLAGSGLWVFPIRPGGKVPLGACEACRVEPRCPGPQRCGHDLCHGLLDASCDPERTGARWAAHHGANVAVATGPSGLAVVDLDGPGGVRQWRELLAVHVDTPRTLTVSTPSGGCHLWYRARPDRPLRNSAKELGPSIDTRGRGGFVVAPPSTRPDGSYRWRDVPDLAALPPVPTWILARLEPPRPAPAPRPAGRPVTPGSTNYLRRAVAGELDRVMGATVGHRNQSLNRAAFALGQLVGAGLLDRAAGATALRQAAESVGLDTRESDRSITSGLNAGASQPRTGTAR
ncbi:MAG TPA: bifunctional DNA primase/polymerase, partial [Mycobacteriales bacterium]|nr:bifunctional DNA primase/polymerase [Mycobacteriales bacterium]